MQGKTPIYLDIYTEMVKSFQEWNTMFHHFIILLFIFTDWMSFLELVEGKSLVNLDYVLLT